MTLAKSRSWITVAGDSQPARGNPSVEGMATEHSCSEF